MSDVHYVLDLADSRAGVDAEVRARLEEKLGGFTEEELAGAVGWLRRQKFADGGHEPSAGAARYLRDLSLRAGEEGGAEIRALLEVGALSNRAVSRRIKELKAAPAAPAPPAGVVTAPGVFEYGGAPYVVRWTRANARGERHLYAVRLVELKKTEGDRSSLSEEAVRFKHVYDPGARMMAVLREEHRMSAADLGAFMLKYSQCIICGRGLTLYTSQNQVTPGGHVAGMGDVCYETAFGHKALLESKRKARASSVQAARCGQQ